MRALPPAAAVATVVAAALVAGCGGGGSGDAGSSTSTAKAKTTAPAAATSGKQLFATVGCASCHTLADAGAKGQVGPDLDTLKPSLAAVSKQVTDGGGGMPAFAGQLSPGQIRAVARYVSSVAGR